MISTTISSLILLSNGLFATPVYISDVKASREAGHLRVEVSADGGIDPEGASTLIDEGRLVIYLGGTRVRADNRSWNLRNGAGEIRAHRHKSQTELVVPLDGNGCSGPVELTGTDTGITALVGCEGTVATPKSDAIRVAAKTPKKTKLDDAKLKQIIELPAALPAPAVSAAIHVAGDAPVVIEGSTTAKTPVPNLASASRATATVTVVPLSPPPPARVNRVEAAKPVPQLASPVPSVLALASSAGAASPGPIPASNDSNAGGLRAVAAPALLLAALAGVAYWFSRRRRGLVQRRHIQILETTSLGPKRALICARIGDETVILSSSEAGISLLKGGTMFTAQAAGESASDPVPALAPAATFALTSAPASAAATSAAGIVGASAHQATSSWSQVRGQEGEGSIEIDQPLKEALADIPEPTGPIGVSSRASFRAIEGGLAGLFGKRDGGLGRDESADKFEDLLEDSLEDQELRQKLAAGISARVR